MSSAPDIDSTRDGALPRHIAVIMDGNNRWAKKRLLPGGAGHKAGESALRRIVEHAARRNIEVLTVFAFSSENWRRPEHEVSLLMKLFLHALEKQVAELHANNIRVRFIGDLAAFAPALQEGMRAGMAKTAGNSGMTLVIAVSYGGQWDVANAARELAMLVQSGRLRAEDIDASRMQQHVQMADLPPVDLLIRTGGELRISNFVLWQAAYAEFHFSEKLWPDFDPDALDEALSDYAGRQRRFGRTSAQVENRHA
ncbi:MAG TPA: polyprenyl diphosphate synthase [Fluviicoccus sp.]|nr:polyprenyl diphosphate synthase [Fluviicoccus sp.]